MADTTKLLPCPFCGNEATILREPSRNAWWVECDWCGARSAETDKESVGAAEIWNRRHVASPPPGEEEVERWARIICEKQGLDPDAPDNNVADGVFLPNWTIYEASARAIIAALGG